MAQLVTFSVIRVTDMSAKSTKHFKLHTWLSANVVGFGWASFASVGSVGVEGVWFACLAFQ